MSKYRLILKNDLTSKDTDEYTPQRHINGMWLDFTNPYGKAISFDNHSIAADFIQEHLDKPEYKLTDPFNVGQY